jgi:penicillin-binding protein 2
MRTAENAASVFTCPMPRPIQQNNDGRRGADFFASPRRHVCVLVLGAFLPGFSEEAADAPTGTPVAAKPAFAAVPQVPYERIDLGPTPMNSQADWQVHSFRIPAPRSLIVSADGTVLAKNRIGRRLVCRLSGSATTPEEAIARVRSLPDEFATDFPLLKITEEEVRRHFQYRPWVPLPVSPVIPESHLCALEDVLPSDCALDTVYVREYPQKELAAHLVGYIGVALPDQHGPIGKVEHVFPPTEGRAGMEKSLDPAIRGTEGEVLRLVDAGGQVRHQEVVKRAEPGETVILTLHLGMQRLGKEMLERSGRPGAFVAIDADNGDVLAMVSHPSFDANVFEGGISQTAYDALATAEDAPLFDRAVTGAYPPGSTFKPFVALAGMEAGQIQGTQTLFPGPAGMVIDGRYFKNHSSNPEGLMDVRYALLRSCNTWFYQAALNIGAGPIAGMSRRFGFGEGPALPLPSVAPGNIPDPDTYGDPRSLANFSIGQGEVLVSPVQLAFAMAGIANGAYIPKPRLIRETVSPETGEARSYFEPAVAHSLGLRPEDVDIIRDGLWGVVNHRAGTAGAASMRNPVVYGKTGTSQWATEGKMRYLAWFAGWVDAEHPRIAFAAVTQGEGYETLSGGRSAAPIAAGVLRKIYEKPEEYAVTVPEGPSRQVSAIAAAAPVPPEVIIEDSGPRNGVGRFFQRLFGGGRRSQRTFPEESSFPAP